MAPKQRQIRMEQRVSAGLMEEMQTRSDEQLEGEKKHRSVAYALLGARAAERYDADTARSWFQKAMVASTHPQERQQIKRMADASLALAERRAGDLKQAVERLGQEAPSSRQLFGLRVMGVIAPPRGASALLRVRGAAVVVLLIAALLGLAMGIVEAVSLPFGSGLNWPPALLLGLILDIVVLAVLATFGRRRQKAARARAAAG